MGDLWHCFTHTIFLVMGYTTKLFQFVDPTFLFSTPPPAQEWAQEAWPALLRPVMKTGYQPSLMVIKQDKLPMDPKTV